MGFLTCLVQPTINWAENWLGRGHDSIPALARQAPLDGGTAFWAVLHPIYHLTSHEQDLQLHQRE